MSGPPELDDAAAARAALQSVPRPPSPRGLLPEWGSPRARTAEAAQAEMELQAVLEEEIMKDMQREALLKQVWAAAGLVEACFWPC
jgi:hypothetical protein